MVQPVTVPRARASVLPWTAALAVALACWWLTARDADRMAGGMIMPGGWTMSMVWMLMPGQSRLAALVMFAGMWTVMMIAMMLPSVMPMVLLYRTLVRGRRAAGRPVAPSVVLLAGYFLAWLGFGLLAFAAGAWISVLAMQHAEISRAIPAAAAVALIVAGAYQLTPLKRVCLRHCRSPLSFVMTSWRDGWLGALRLGIHHGAYCVACCWALMLIQLAIGVMNIPVMLATAVVIGLEKTWRYGERAAVAVGSAAIAAGLVMIVRALS